jgi:ribonuclease BN (tRNA processing enzyme)
MKQDYFLKVIGSSDAFHHGKKLHTSFFYHTPGHNFLIDCGATTLLGLRQNNISTQDIDTIIISHLHGDHFAGLPFLLLDMHKVHKRSKLLQMIMPADGQQKLEQLFKLLYPGSEDTLEELPIEYIPHDKNNIIQKFLISAIPVAHTPHLKCYGISITDQHKKFAFSGDTEWSDNLLKISEKADIFLCECNFYDQDFNGHLNYQRLIENRDKFTCKKMFLTHAGKKMLDMKDLSIPIVQDGKIYNL